MRGLRKIKGMMLLKERMNVQEGKVEILFASVNLRQRDLP